MSRLSGRIALVTGASRGIGAAVAKRFAAEGAHLVLVARTVGGLEETDDAIQKISGQSATLVPMDLRDYDKIDQLGHALYQRFGKLDVVVGNAGALEALGPVAQYDPKLWSRVMDLNVTANYRLIRSMDPLLRASGTGRAIFVTSAAARAQTRPAIMNETIMPGPAFCAAVAVSTKIPVPITAPIPSRVN